MATYIEHTDIGATLTTWIYTSLWQLYAAEKTGRKGYINWPRDRMRALRPYFDERHFDICPNMWDWYFEQPLFDAVPPRDETWCWTDKNEVMSKAIGGHCLYGPVPQIKEFYKKHLRLNKDVNARGDALVKKYGIDFKNTIGVTWRGTDSIIDGRPRMPIETYFPFIDDILEKEPNLRIMCTAEEENILWPLLDRYKNAFMIQEFFTTPTGNQQLGDNPERFSKLPGYERGMQPALMVYLFSKCAHYVKNRSSTGAVASWLSDGRIICLAHPENLGHGFDITKAEICGEIVPLNR